MRSMKQQQEVFGMKKRVFLAVALAAALAGCASGVKLDDVPVEDKQGAAVAPATTPTPQADGSRVAQVDASRGALDAAGPNNVGRIVYFDYDSNTIKPEFQNL